MQRLSRSGQLATAIWAEDLVDKKRSTEDVRRALQNLSSEVGA